METPERYVIKGGIFPALYPGACTLDYEHPVKRGDKVGKIQYADNPMVPIPGVACKRCTAEIKLANS
jgi:hypothetical protein